MPLLTSFLVLIVSARLLGKFFTRHGQPAIVGEMLAGVLLGPTVLNLVRATPALHGLSELAVFLVVLSAGLEMNFKDVANALTGRGLVIAGLGFFVPLLAGLTVGVLFDLDLMRTTFLGLCVSITALPVAVRMLESFGMLNTRMAQYIVATAIVNDVAALLVLGVILGLPPEKSATALTWSILLTGGKLLLFAAAVLGFNYLLQHARRAGAVIHSVPEKLMEIFGGDALFGLVAVFVLVFGSVSEMLGFHFVVGAFFGALLIDRDLFLDSRYAELEKTLGSITGGFLAPLFFAYLGLEFNVAEIRSVEFVVAVLLISVLSKILAGWLGGKLIGLSPHESLGIGIILNGRGIMELVIASIAFEHGFIGQGMFSTLVLMGVITTMITPMLFRRFVILKLDLPNGPRI